MIGLVLEAALGGLLLGGMLAGLVAGEIAERRRRAVLRERLAFQIERGIALGADELARRRMQRRARHGSR